MGPRLDRKMPGPIGDGHVGTHRSFDRCEKVDVQS